MAVATAVFKGNLHPRSFLPEKKLRGEARTEGRHAAERRGRSIGGLYPDTLSDVEVFLVNLTEKKKTKVSCPDTVFDLLGRGGVVPYRIKQIFSRI